MLIFMKKCRAFAVLLGVSLRSLKRAFIHPTHVLRGVHRMNDFHQFRMGSRSVLAGHLSITFEVCGSKASWLNVM